MDPGIIFKERRASAHADALQNKILCYVFDIIN